MSQWKMNPDEVQSVITVTAKSAEPYETIFTPEMLGSI